MPTLDVDGVALHYEEQGAGPPVVFSHGLLWSGHMFDAQVAALSSRHRCIAYDHRGQGRSGASPRPYDMERLYEDAVAVIERLGAAPCHFVGLSMGGFVGMRIALRRPELLRSLTLMCTAGDGEPRLNVVKYRLMMAVGRVLGLGVLARAVMPIMFGRTFLGDPRRREVRDKMEQQLRGLVLDRVGPALESVATRRPVLGELGALRTPTLVLHGDEDRAIAPARAQRTAQAIPGARMVLVPRAGHTATVEEPEAMTRELAAFIERVGG